MQKINLLYNLMLTLTGGQLLHSIRPQTESNLKLGEKDRGITNRNLKSNANQFQQTL